MPPRMDPKAAHPDSVRALTDFSATVEALFPDRKLRDLVYARVSQLNSCAYCIDMHAKDMRANGESEERLYMLDAWRESPLYDARERAALAFAEAATRLGRGGVSEETYQLALRHFSEKDLVGLTLAIVAINGWNRLNTAFRTKPGSYKPVRRARAATAA